MDKVDLLSNEDFLVIVKKHLGTKNFKILETSLGPFSEILEGFLGEHHILTIKFKFQGQELEEHFFIKTLPIKNPSQKHLVEVVGFWKKESQMYKNIFPKFEEMNYKTDFLPKCYLVNNEAIVMENLKNRGYSTVERNTFLDYEHCKAAMEALAMFHANSLAYEESRSREGKLFRFDQEYPEAFQEIFFGKTPFDYTEKYHLCGKKCIAALADLFPMETTEWKESLKQKILDFNFIKVCRTPLPYRRVCSHGDIWVNNLLFKKEASKINCILIDFQITRYSHPSLDALLLLYCSTSRTFRKEHKTSLLDFHFDRLGHHLQSYGYDLQNILSKEDYLHSAKIFEPLACFQAARNKTITHLPVEVINKISSNGINFTDLVFSDLRIKLVVEAFQSSEEFRKVTTDDIYDIMELL